ncbi:uncharacterized protein I303_108510 [Kwoniella dejecticola CBS 10117]|uniref:Uncharacterized protein n=1 Tax=Kwoniella dejecticola CBS 10117 TaxID=1296121 RepID=A0A1A5ZX76_9TREE|nr:uncharacterized protein I303_07166 [Kwoniella dejecticola CBS 10117]OBR82407.1 hypothetical protein I303_07166 [Kwoniella dejecticola CBS 10117]
MSSTVPRARGPTERESGIDSALAGPLGYELSCRRKLGEHLEAEPSGLNATALAEWSRQLSTLEYNLARAKGRAHSFLYFETASQDENGKNASKRKSAKSRWKNRLLEFDSAWCDTRNALRDGKIKFHELIEPEVVTKALNGRIGTRTEGLTLAEVDTTFYTRRDICQETGTRYVYDADHAGLPSSDWATDYSTDMW